MIGLVSPLPLTALTLVKLGVILLGVFNLALTFTGPLSSTHSPSVTEARQVRIHNHPSLQLLQLDTRTRPRTVTLITEETEHYPNNGTLADLEWASLVPSANDGLVFLGPPSDVRPYTVSMFHMFHCLDRIRRAIMSPEDSKKEKELPRPRYGVHHCFNYLRQMVLCAADTRLNPINHVNSMGNLGSDGIGLAYECRDWDAVYEAFDANAALNRASL